MRETLVSDQGWHVRGGVLQHGSVHVVESELEESTNEHAVVRVTIDAMGVTVTAEGEETWVDYSDPIVTRFELEKADRWRVASSSSDN